MKLTSRSEYALLALIYLARNSQGNYTSVDQIADAQKIPPKFLEQILLILKKAGLLFSIQGQKGGYKLSRPAAQIYLVEILCLFENTFSNPNAVPLKSMQQTSLVDEVKLNLVFSEIHEFTNQKLARTSLAELC
jgi:Rrf2 family transcriptional regulator, cysteine metabolism repressor